MGLKIYRRAHGGGSYIKKYSTFPRGGDFMNEPMWTSDVDYSQQWKFVRYVHLLATLCVLSTIVQSIVMNVKRHHKFLRTVQTLREIGIWA